MGSKKNTDILKQHAEEWSKKHLPADRKIVFVEDATDAGEPCLNVHIVKKDNA